MGAVKSNSGTFKLQYMNLIEFPILQKLTKTKLNFNEPKLTSTYLEVLFNKKGNLNL